MKDLFSFFNVLFGSNWFGNFFQFSGFRGLLKNPLMLFVYGIISKWYITVMVAAIVVTFWVFKGLQETGILQKAETTVTRALEETKSVAQNCVPKILNFSDFWYCLENPPRYKPTEGEEALRRSLEIQLLPEKSGDIQDPYAQPDPNQSRL